MRPTSAATKAALALSNVTADVAAGNVSPSVPLRRAAELVKAARCATRTISVAAAALKNSRPAAMKPGRIGVAGCATVADKLSGRSRNNRTVPATMLIGTTTSRLNCLLRRATYRLPIARPKSPSSSSKPPILSARSRAEKISCGWMRSTTAPASVTKDA